MDTLWVTPTSEQQHLDHLQLVTEVFITINYEVMLKTQADAVVDIYLTDQQIMEICSINKDMIKTWRKKGLGGFKISGKTSSWRTSHKDLNHFIRNVLTNNYSSSSL